MGRVPGGSTAKEDRERARLARLEDQAMEEEVRLKEMPLTLLKLLARSYAVDLDTSVYLAKDTGEIEISFADKYGDHRHITLKSSFMDVRNVECDIETAEFDRAELRKREKLRASAIAKLDEDERAALGL